VTGDIGSGKSSVCECLKNLGAVTIDSDLVAREVTGVGSSANQIIAQEFGKDILLGDGSLNREALAKIVFKDADSKHRLESILHPIIKDHIDKRLSQIRHDLPEAWLIVVEATLLYEAGWEPNFDGVLLVQASKDSRSERLINSRGMIEADVKNRMASQPEQRFAGRKPMFIIENSGNFQHLQQETAKVMKEIRQLLANRHSIG